MVIIFLDVIYKAMKLIYMQCKGKSKGAGTGQRKLSRNIKRELKE